MTGVSESSFSFVSYNHTPPGSMCGRYASYRNAFLFNVFFFYFWSALFTFSTLFNTNELISWSQSHTSKYCGKLEHDQQGKVITPPPSPVPLPIHFTHRESNNIVIINNTTTKKYISLPVNKSNGQSFPNTEILSVVFHKRSITNCSKHKMYFHFDNQSINSINQSTSLLIDSFFVCCSHWYCWSLIIPGFFAGDVSVWDGSGFFKIFSSRKRLPRKIYSCKQNTFLKILGSESFTRWLVWVLALVLGS